MNFRALEKSIRVLEKSSKSPGNLFLKKGMNPAFRLPEKPPNNDYSFRTLWQFLKAVHLKKGKYLTW